MALGYEPYHDMPPPQHQHQHQQMVYVHKCQPKFPESIATVTPGSLDSDHAHSSDPDDTSSEPSHLLLANPASIASSLSSSSLSSSSQAQHPQSIFDWYTVRPPSHRSTPVTRSAIPRRHIAISHACLTYSRVYSPEQQNKTLPRPLEPFPLDDY